MKEILDEVNELEISIVVNNVGLLEKGYYHNIEPNNIIDLIKVNCCSMSLITHYFIPIFLERTKSKKLKCALVNVSSVCGLFPISFYNIYCASKVFMDRLSTILEYEYPEIDFLRFNPSYVSTPMTNHR